MSRRPRGSQGGANNVEKLAELVGREVRARCGPDSTFEERRTMAARVLEEAVAEVLLVAEEGSEAPRDDE